MSKILLEVQSQLADRAISDNDLRTRFPNLQDMWNKIQELKREMNQAKKEAADLAAKPYLEAIETMEKQYATISKLGGS